MALPDALRAEGMLSSEELNADDSYLLAHAKARFGVNRYWSTALVVSFVGLGTLADFAFGGGNYCFFCFALPFLVIFSCLSSRSSIIGDASFIAVINCLGVQYTSFSCRERLGQKVLTMLEILTSGQAVSTKVA